MRQTYLDMAIKMAELGSESLQATYRHSRQFLRGVTDFDDDGNYAWKRGAYAAVAYKFSKKAAPDKHLKDYNKVLHGEHVIPLSMVSSDGWNSLMLVFHPRNNDLFSSIISKWFGSQWPSSRNLTGS